MANDYFPDYDWPFICYNIAISEGVEAAEECAKKMKEDPSHASQFIGVSHKTFEIDKNPKEVWKALDVSLFLAEQVSEGDNGDKDIVKVYMPRWVYKYLKKVARYLSLVSPGKGTRLKDLVFEAFGYKKGKQSSIHDSLQDIHIYKKVKEYDGPLKPSADDPHGAFATVGGTLKKSERAIEDAYYRTKRNLDKIKVEIRKE
ncbi:MAG: hypothetical protein R6U55_10935 [Desulfovermiculus sp.]